MIIKQQIQWVLAGAAATGLLLLYYFFDARKVPFPQCPFYTLTRLYCPGCGAQRALSALLHGELLMAARYNFLLVAFLPLLAYSAYVKLKPVKKQPCLLFYNQTFAWAVFAVIVLFWCLRNIPVQPFLLMAPQA